ncbi:DNA replication initiation control protein YabA [Streptococcus acidominimus]|uniref:Replication initiation control protein YabA n=1 Tax=Streptococcus acidominimus TaxID=1326 RepID=A0A1Q8EBK7_STRAI|nr:DNA replication initiation control protein YabA [Streptococcus acidominimus]MBF0846329.1 DNA replication initiation control protein YabA [Streptococcus danieliae]MBF0819404.1 DNA replication initiation control protein YabA [Streptococcus acidominimus]MBF0840072.1 DNA replication initiation control protein YabA [Streptococcus acidominimus]OLF49170.1 DNA replication initiation control protein YabA [Streptococcus acidominimus]TFU29918.1 DNA replication initiation control protein YabA [Streptoc
MDKKEIFDALDGFSQNLLVTLAEVEAIKKHLRGVIEENTDLRLENSKLRERLEKDDREQTRTANFGKENLENIYEDGFHICTFSYGQRRDNDEPCMFCLELLNRE